MAFIHDDPEFDDLLRIVAERSGLSIGVVEKDYWVTHTLWAIQHQGFEVWFKGGTSLSKGFGLIERFSEDLDVKVEPGRVTDLPPVIDWTRESTRATTARRVYFEALARLLDVPGTAVTLSVPVDEQRWTGANLEVRYPGRHLDALGILKPFVVLEVGSARVTPFLERDLTSFVHEYLAEIERLGEYQDNAPRAVRCVHPLVTLIEKLDALQNRVRRDDREPATFVRHFEDAAHVIASTPELPALAGYSGVSALVDEMVGERQIRQRPISSDPVFTPSNDDRWESIRRAYQAIGPMFWGARIELDAACQAIREWIAGELEQ